ncbi:hypothetical protein K443DRAFT_14992 [Laccaria amethystina LaAM-08-1]|uniref:Uncharacterized protein n=1 Tax=Laccaria amethystina LaAM-08-1 TaxID=1095629 RepID=A0A0C9WZH7_9AGAR|nr:hypothetical protein K443DRAFT_14992 [Laccaria amethystina LaAM-08-1]
MEGAGHQWRDPAADTRLDTRFVDCVNLATNSLPELQLAPRKLAVNVLGDRDAGSTSERSQLLQAHGDHLERIGFRTFSSLDPAPNLSIHNEFFVLENLNAWFYEYELGFSFVPPLPVYAHCDHENHLNVDFPELPLRMAGDSDNDGTNSEAEWPTRLLDLRRDTENSGGAPSSG